ncbi:UDP-galactose transporter senju [Tribolium castaneum]|uniref:CMP-sialic acid transporter-like Protein n=1 Tax=Tribolium castaneum TaxID=7070 RepID=D2A1X8_TRICA|nr:PREDICTED: CMP-sialic acid transporter 1 isoform X1 [Tribolium castaneum]XP_973292.1 PREDICTED: CMP-sialic acid transporter 1 isoform X1 [Tribolium castaneum]EFA02069.1 CMP-sialic acid transporter-like Protein [Tribolium castaneum]|eukprot:XP_015834983.1 PREDICTED: CMP-sialic acid transporter 1 isoform X1 [Tribolium castaneum]
MSTFSWIELFPTKLSFVIFLAYILLFVGQGILVTASQKADNQYDYNIITVVLLTEVLKLIVSTLLYCKDNSPKSLVNNIVENRKVLGLYFVPALLYCFYNNLAFVNLSVFDPTTYYLLLQLRVVVTGILFQVIFSKTLSKKQWLSLLILTFGCMLKQINFTNQEKKSFISFDIVGLNGIFILLQIFCSCLAGVYNEYLLKKQGADVNIFIQNVFMYLDSIVCNVVLLSVRVSLSSAFTYENISKVFHYKVLLVMFNNAAIGIVTSFFLKTLNSILKTFASALELVLTAILSYLFFRIAIHLNTVLAIGAVMYAVYLYSQNPVSSKASSRQSDQIALIKSEQV